MALTGKSQGMNSISVVFISLLKGVLKDKISLFWAVIFPIALYSILGMVFKEQGQRMQLLIGTTAMGALFFSLFGIAFEVVTQRNRGVYKLLHVTPFRTISFISALSLARLAVTIASSLLVLGVGIVMYGLTINIWHLLSMVPMLLVGSMTFILLGFIIANLSQNENQVSILTNIISMPMLFGSEAFYSLRAAPAWVRTICNMLPFDYLSDGLRASVNGDYHGLAVACGFVSLYALIFLVGAVMSFNWEFRRGGSASR